MVGCGSPLPDSLPTNRPPQGLSCAACFPQLPQEHRRPCVHHTFIIREFRRWWYSSPPCCTSGGWRLIPIECLLRLVLTVRLALFSVGAGLLTSPSAMPCSNTLAWSSPISSPTGLTEPMVSRVFVSPGRLASTAVQSIERRCTPCIMSVGPQRR